MKRLPKRTKELSSYMKKVAKIALSGRKKGTYKRISDGYDWKLDDLVFDKEEPRPKKCLKK